MTEGKFVKQGYFSIEIEDSLYIKNGKIRERIV